MKTQPLLALRHPGETGSTEGINTSSTQYLANIPLNNALHEPMAPLGKVVPAHAHADPACTKCPESCNSDNAGSQSITWSNNTTTSFSRNVTNATKSSNLVTSSWSMSDVCVVDTIEESAFWQDCVQEAMFQMVKEDLSHQAFKRELPSGTVCFGNLQRLWLSPALALLQLTIPSNRRWQLSISAFGMHLIIRRCLR